MPKIVETLVRTSAAGEYGIPIETRLVRIDDGSYFLLHDGWCGVGSVEGETYRPFAYIVPKEDVAAVTARFPLANPYQYECLGRADQLAFVD